MHFVLSQKHGIFELDMVLAGKVVAPAALAQCGAISEFVSTHGPALVSRLNSACPQLRLTGVDTVKAQLNTGGGGCFPMHYDTSSVISNRAVTALFYLNPRWEPVCRAVRSRSRLVVHHLHCDAHGNRTDL
eukprot:SAG11_NODE_129_length_15500_cov_16.145250_19_plen_131_part_00